MVVCFCVETEREERVRVRVFCRGRERNKKKREERKREQGYVCLQGWEGEKKDVWKELRKERRAATTTTKREKALDLKAPKFSKCRHVATKNNGPCACSMRKPIQRHRLLGVALYFFFSLAREFKGGLFPVFLFYLLPILGAKSITFH